ncbi:MAG: DUF3820 family protein [Acidobacteriota bacterium]
MDPEDLVRIARMPMPFGKYQGRPLIDLPEEYLLWFADNGGFPGGSLGRLMELALAIRIEGLEGLVKPLKHTREPRIDLDDLNLPPRRKSGS